ncbi:uncharacterized protein F5891DRAFT_1034839, partial [Suillus fuscotomentosus]
MMGTGLGTVVMPCHSAVAAELCMTSVLTKQFHISNHPLDNDSISLVRLKSAESLIYGSTYTSLTIVPFPFLVQASSSE